MERDGGAAALARNALEWLLVMAQQRGTALAWTGRPDDDELDPTLYSGTAGIVLAFLEGYRHFGNPETQLSPPAWPTARRGSRLAGLFVCGNRRDRSGLRARMARAALPPGVPAAGGRRYRRSQPGRPAP